ncbi:MAG: hypothetical protein UX13_C0022G0012 [Candidatus Woesebacteria bacterium GW2011_GWB1_45_5]|uniref:DUF192 domain-containing protein n=1 Tax=Candidatus Woesebacteria bacterium GW2011_GWB1_45_5 TaxID=1618581 RepID=A0A0G1MNW3_9BACT|nr:MAG: hypothetical protein UX13_C0022G0012 [Candidatus Woesebacteria bacterium GW2011_GWB1_45_5]
MFKQIVLPFLLVAAFVTGVGIFVKNSKNLKFTIAPNSTATAEKTVTIGESVIKVEIADTQSQRAKGLSGRSSIEENSGMIFVFDSQNVTPIFWMKDMIIPIDIVWINDGKVVKIDTNIRPPKENTPDKNLPTYVAGQPVDYVLEVNAGFVENQGIKIGDSVQIQFNP